MATLKLILDTRYINSDGLYSLKLAFGHKGQTAYMKLPMRLTLEQLDAKKQCVVNNERKTILNAMLKETFSECQQALYVVMTKDNGAHLTAAELRDMVINFVKPQSENDVKFSGFFKRFGENHEAQRTRELYEATWRKIEKFASDAENLKFEDINRNWLDTFFLWLASDSPSVNARNIHLRNIRSVFNAAIDEEITTVYPFRRYRIKPVETPKRSLTPNQLRYIFDANTEPWQRKYIDMFKLSFLLIGINIGDLLSLSCDCIQNGRIEFNRKKTHRLYSIKILPEAKELIEKYKGEKYLLSFLDRYSNYRDFAAKLNKALQTIMPNITTYYARHSWATIAASLDIPKETIAAALGHGGNTVTDVYIKFDQKKVDSANRRVADFVLYGK